jgi:DNA (cytosine-5)-methyltransferase 1
MVEDLMASQCVVLDMFAGAGGLTEGFARKNVNFVSHIEMDCYAARTLETRTLYHVLKEKNRERLYYQYYNGYITRDEFIEECKSLGLLDTGIINQEISAETEQDIISIIRTRLSDLNLPGIDVIIGGPPCQAYSLIGRGRDPDSMRNDPRNQLYLHYLRFLQEFEPQLFVFENVPGLISARNGEIFLDLITRLNRLGYSTGSNFQIVNARDFGVLQERKRIIFIGWKMNQDCKYPEFPKTPVQSKVWNLLNDLPELEPGTGTDGPQRYRAGRPSNYLRNMGIRNGEVFVRNHAARSHNDRDREIYRRVITEWNTNKRRVKYNDLPENLKTHRNRSSFLDRFKVVDGNSISHAVVAHASRDGHYFIHPDIQQARSLTVRELARIQSFPDNYLFEGSRQAQYTQVGNAVPPLMAEGIATAIVDLLGNL